MNLAQNSDLIIVSDSEAASIICRFTPEMIHDIVEEAIQNKYRSYSMTLANIVGSLESNFKIASAAVPDYTNEVLSQREDSYRQIIAMVCNAHQLSYVATEGMEDIYSSAYHIYDLLISQFNIRIVNFFVNYINREKSMIYDNLQLSTKKKELSSYSKRLYKGVNSKLAVIHANLEFVLQNICAYDVDFETFLEIAYIPDRMQSRFLQSVLQDNGDFFKRIIVPYYQHYYAMLTTQIKFALQGFAAAELSDVI